jgi:3-oxoacyl-[acyl-carrier protein] reductase
MNSTTSTAAGTAKTALVTGASRGIGRAVALGLAARGVLVAVHYNKDEAAAERALADLRQAGGDGFPVQGELGVPGDAEELRAAFDKAAAAHGAAPGLDILVNNAGVEAWGRIHEVAEADYDRAFAVNVRAPFFLIARGLERVRDGGRIVNLSSGVTKIAFPSMAAYAATKGALETLTLTLAQDLGPRGITVNAVAPGTIETDIHPWLADPEARATAAAFSVFNRVGQPEDVAGVVAFLASEEARWVTGQVVDAGGGSGMGL